MQFGGAVIKKMPFLLQEQGWGEFDMEIVLHAIDKGGDHTLRHDLNFQKPKYEAIHNVVSNVRFYYRNVNHVANASWCGVDLQKSGTELEGIAG